MVPTVYCSPTVLSDHPVPLSADIMLSARTSPGPGPFLINNPPPPPGGREGAGVPQHGGARGKAPPPPAQSAEINAQGAATTHTMAISRPAHDRHRAPCCRVAPPPLATLRTINTRSAPPTHQIYPLIYSMLV